MQQEMFNLFNVFSKTAFDAGRQITDINARTYEKLMKRQIELSSDFIESAVKQGLSHYMAAQKQLVEEYVDKAQKANKDTVNIITQAQNEVNSYLEDKLPAAFNELKSVAQDATGEAADNTRSAASKRAA